MMAAGTFDWTMAAQARRVAAVDTRSIGIDALYGLVYVLGGFYASPQIPNASVWVVLGPFLALSVVLIYMTFRLCQMEREEKTAMFYANLPRGRSLSYWMHAAWLGGFALIMEAVIVLGVWMRLGFARPDQTLFVAPSLFLLPFFSFACFIWLIYGGYRKFIEIAGVIAALVVWGIIIWGVYLRIEESGSKIFPRDLGAALALALLSGLLLWHGSRRWRKTQIGEVS